MPFPRELIEDICEEHLELLAEVFQLQDHRRYTNWGVTFLCINGDFLQRGGDYKVASRMIKEMGRWVAKGIPPQPLFLMLANAYENDQCMGRTGKTIYIDPGSPWQNGYIERFHSRFRDECLSRELLLNLREARVVIADWRQHYNEDRPHSRLGYLSPEDFKHTKILTT